jgi:hypothetical protein
VDVVLRVFDSNLNYADVVQNGVTVSDTVKPVFLKPPLSNPDNCSEYEDLSGVGYIVGVPDLELIDGTHYGDNCSVTEIWYKIVNLDYPAHDDLSYIQLNSWNDLLLREFYEGHSEIWFYLVDGSDNKSERKVMFNVEVLNMPNPVGLGGD